ncbi:predicted protein [Plenodomus lingam JN3]|uniref:Predicted protein n=1 Tax=Leptosphaeria maculans (strain JN3 / isolate v23.1.3 / race Av1-4-5-6-7-8) TaxID=985895 RepID=E5A2V9_LEPMJ|nr:predicted protein [Plenodomus lingam JN3]CBX97905.1 predicted protein [Plenodomus lingam JN3]
MTFPSTIPRHPPPAHGETTRRINIALKSSSCANVPPKNVRPVQQGNIRLVG